MKNNRLPYFVGAFVLGFGFLTGLWMAAGIDPQGEIARAVAGAVNSIHSGWGDWIRYIPTILTGSSVIGACVLGRWLGLLSVALAFIAGLIIASLPIPSLVFLAAAVGVVAWSPGAKCRRVISNIPHGPGYLLFHPVYRRI